MLRAGWLALVAFFALTGGLGDAQTELEEPLGLSVLFRARVAGAPGCRLEGEAGLGGAISASPEATECSWVLGAPNSVTQLSLVVQLDSADAFVAVYGTKNTHSSHFPSSARNTRKGTYRRAL